MFLRDTLPAPNRQRGCFVFYNRFISRRPRADGVYYFQLFVRADQIDRIISTKTEYLRIDPNGKNGQKKTAKPMFSSLSLMASCTDLDIS